MSFARVSPEYVNGRYDTISFTVTFGGRTGTETDTSAGTGNGVRVTALAVRLFSHAITTRRQRASGDEFRSTGVGAGAGAGEAAGFDANLHSRVAAEKSQGATFFCRSLNRFDVYFFSRPKNAFRSNGRPF